MFNPYLSAHESALRPARGSGETGNGPLQGILRRLGRLDSDDLLLLLLIYLLARKEDEDGIWPLVALGLYLML